MIPSNPTSLTTGLSSGQQRRGPLSSSSTTTSSTLTPNSFEIDTCSTMVWCFPIPLRSSFQYLTTVPTFFCWRLQWLKNANHPWIITSFLVLRKTEEDLNRSLDSVAMGTAEDFNNCFIKIAKWTLKAFPNLSVLFLYLKGVLLKTNPCSSYDVIFPSVVSLVEGNLWCWYVACEKRGGEGRGWEGSDAFMWRSVGFCSVYQIECICGRKCDLWMSRWFCT